MRTGASARAGQEVAQERAGPERAVAAEEPRDAKEIPDFDRGTAARACLSRGRREACGIYFEAASRLAVGTADG
jgi:hypothetical protein